MFPVNFPTFRHISVVKPAEGILCVRWILEPTAYPLDDINFEVFRSNSPSGPWDLVGTPQQGVFEYTDYNAPGDYVTRTFYYVVRAASVSGKGYRDSEPHLLQHDEDSIARELVRKKNVYLTVKCGVPLAVLIRKTWGARCSRCWNAERNSAADADCPECYGTGFTGGFLNPVFVPGMLGPASTSIVDAGFKYEPGETYMELSNHPLLSPRDVIVDRRLNLRYSVEDVRTTLRRGHYISQMAKVLRLDSNDPTYRIVIPEPRLARLNRGWEMVRGY